ncbi:MAG: EamA family transporter RarD [Anaerolineaceae bacterium]
MFNKGILYSLGAYVIWGFFPILFKSLIDVPALQILAHRFVWCLVVVVILLAARKEIAALKAAVTRRALLIYAAAGVLLTINWGTYVWAVNAGHVLESSFGYFINPLVNVLLGTLFLREKLRPMQWVPVGLAAAAVLYLTISFGQLPWIALVLAFSFGLYGLVKKLAPLGPLQGMAVETTAILIPAAAYLLLMETAGTGSFGHGNPLTTVLLIFAGVATCVPLLLFSAGAQTTPLSIMGLLQYVSPTIQFLIGVLIYHEPFTRERLIGFIIIWIALSIFSVESFNTWRKSVSLAAAEAEEGIIKPI